WKSLYVCHGDLLCWVDADIRNFRADFVTRLLAPLLNDPDVGMVKGFYRRPLHDDPTGGGRVTELMARPVPSYPSPLLTRFVPPSTRATRRSRPSSCVTTTTWRPSASPSSCASGHPWSPSPSTAPSSAESRPLNARCAQYSIATSTGITHPPARAVRLRSPPP